MPEEKGVPKQPRLMSLTLLFCEPDELKAIRFSFTEHSISMRSKMH